MDDVQYNVQDAEGRWHMPQVGDTVPGLGRLLEEAGPWFVVESQPHLWLIHTVPNSGYVFKESVFLAQ